MSEWYYDKQIEVMTQADGTLDDDGIYHNGVETVVKTIDCDIQPYTKEQAYKDYGFVIECTKRVFCDNDTVLELGGIVRYNNELYAIKRLINWDDYCDIMLNNV